ncbi:hypothetical protein MBLNU459_g2198t1 [Dothideomycetes sp. NU459]
MSLHDHSRLYIGLAFAAGIVLTLGYKDVYPDLERRFRQRLQSARAPAPLTAHQITLDAHPQQPAKVDPSAAHQQHQQHAPGAPYEIRTGIEGTIGNTPLIKIKSLSEATGCEILAKAEFLNGAGNSPKDRVALSIIQHAEEEGLLTPNSGDVVYEGTVGSTGISLAAICRARGYLAHICMPSDVATEKSDLLLKLGAVVERVQPASIVDANQFVNAARARAAAHTASPTTRGRGFFADQFENPANHLAHYASTGPEILAQCGGALDAFVAGAGTGGTISGTAMYLKPRARATTTPTPGAAEGEQPGRLRVVLADPQGSGLYNKVKHGVMFSATEREGTRRRHQVDSIVEGVGVNRLTANFDAGRDLIDDAVRVSDAQALKMARWLVEKDGLFVGASSAVNCVAAVKVARDLGEGKRVVTILCDSGARHLSKFWRIAGDVGGDGGSVTLDDILDCTD